MTLRPVVAAAAEVIQQGRAEIVVPREPVNIARLVQVVVIGVVTGKRRRTVWTGCLQIFVVAVIERDAILLFQILVQFDAELVSRLNPAAG